MDGEGSTAVTWWHHLAKAGHVRVLTQSLYWTLGFKEWKKKCALRLFCTVCKSGFSFQFRQHSMFLGIFNWRVIIRKQLIFCLISNTTQIFHIFFKFICCLETTPKKRNQLLYIFALFFHCFRSRSFTEPIINKKFGKIGSCLQVSLEPAEF